MGRQSLKNKRLTQRKPHRNDVSEFDTPFLAPLACKDLKVRTQRNSPEGQVGVGKQFISVRARLCCLSLKLSPIRSPERESPRGFNNSAPSVSLPGRKGPPPSGERPTVGKQRAPGWQFIYFTHIHHIKCVLSVTVPFHHDRGREALEEWMDDG